MALRVLLLVYSGTGNTGYLSRLFAAALAQLGHDVTTRDIDHLSADAALPPADLVGLGSPVYHAAPPAHVLRFLSRVEGRGLPVFTFLTLGLYGGNCARLLQQAAAARGLRPVAGFEALFPGSDFAAQWGRGSWIHRRLNLRISRDLPGKVARFCAGLRADLPQRIAPASWYAPLNDLVKPLALRAYERYKRGLGVLPDRCTGGGWCVGACPEGALSLQQGRAVVDPARCSLCFRCYHRCPTQALVFFGRDDRGRYAGPHEARHFVPLPGEPTPSAPPCPPPR